MADGAGRRNDVFDGSGIDRMVATLYINRIPQDQREALSEELGRRGYGLRVLRPTVGMEIPTLRVNGTTYRGERAIQGYLGERTYR